MDVGVKYTCVKSASPGYRVGSEYIPFMGKDGVRYIKGSDGITDRCDMLQSSFRKSKGVKITVCPHP